MGITGKYSFPGIKKAGTTALNLVLASTAWGAWILASPFKPGLDLIEGWLIDWLANKGLLIIDVGMIYVNGEIDQANFDKAFQDAIDSAKMPGLSDAQKKVIDDKVINAFREFGRIGDSPQ